MEGKYQLRPPKKSTAVPVPAAPPGRWKLAAVFFAMTTIGASAMAFHNAQSHKGAASSRSSSKSKKKNGKSGGFAARDMGDALQKLKDSLKLSKDAGEHELLEKLRTASPVMAGKILEQLAEIGGDESIEVLSDM